MNTDKTEKKKDKYIIFNHTADIGLTAFGNTLEQAFCNAAIGMFEIMFGTDHTKKVLQNQTISPGSRTVEKEIMVKEFTVIGQDLEGTLVRMLTETLYLFIVEHLVLLDLNVTIANPDNIQALQEAAGKGSQNRDIICKVVMKAELFDQVKHGHPLEIKAVTYHMLEIVKPDKKNEKWSIRVLFDI